MAAGLVISSCILLGCVLAALLAFAFPGKIPLAMAGGLAAIVTASMLVFGNGFLSEGTLRLSLFSALPVTIAALVGSWVGRKGFS